MCGEVCLEISQGFCKGGPSRFPQDQMRILSIFRKDALKHNLHLLRFDKMFESVLEAGDGPPDYH